MMNTSQNPLAWAWKWFIPRSTDPAVEYRERALRVLLPVILVLRMAVLLRDGFTGPGPSELSAPIWLRFLFVVIPILLSFYFLIHLKVDTSGAFLLLHWFLIDLLNLPLEGYWYPGHQISLIIQIILSTLFLPTRAILPFLMLQILTFGSWGYWLDQHYFDPPLLSSGEPVADFRTTILTLAAQETLILFILRYLRLQMERALRLQQVSILRLETDLVKRKQAEEKAAFTARQLGIMNEVGRAVSEEINLKTVLEIIRQQLEKIIAFDLYSVRMFNESNGTVIHLAVYESGRYWDEPDSPLLPDTHAYRVQATGESILHLMTEEEIQEYEAGPYPQIGDRSSLTTSLIFAPLKKQGRTIGALSVQRRERNAYTQEHLALVEAVAIQVSIAIENARLFESLQRELQDRIATERMREELISELELKNAELERFTYTVSHDLRSPLVTIKGFLGMLEKDLKENRPDRVRGDVQRISNAADKMDALLADLLELSRIGRIVNPPVEIDTVRLVNDAIESLDAQIHTRNIRLTVAPSLPDLYGDQVRLREVFENLIGNAAKYMGDQHDPRIDIGLRSEDHQQFFYVKDNGIGIDKEYHARIFNLFEKLNPGAEGTGIGLALVKRIVEVHGGRIWVESGGLGTGSTFCFSLPLAHKPDGQ